MKKMRWIIPLLIAAVVAVVLLAVFGRDTEPGDGPSITESAPIQDSAEPSTPTAAPATASPGLATIAITSDPDEYANSVAAFLFSFDTRTAGPEDYRAALLAEADPLMSDSGFADLEVMVDYRIPEVTQWARMQANEQWSRWELTATWEPETWIEIVTDGLAEPGWVMRNVTGVQTTYYVDADEGREAVSEPTVTIGMRCPAPNANVERCHVALIGTSVVP